ncbi:hypothetical protein CDAR_603041 [Caerostris darwini]|uniref:Uncharacterized protein n=1 Tax=Caerostris darwini TaxID=1538125 RepID=A0AAV4N8F2_9ARAC|nr:hypothetical protein CDAR_603041 [Caerostris darwini]
MKDPCHSRASINAKFVKNTARNIAPHQSEIIMICGSQRPRVHRGKSKPNSCAAVIGKEKAAFDDPEVKERHKIEYSASEGLNLNLLSFTRSFLFQFKMDSFINLPGKSRCLIGKGINIPLLRERFSRHLSRYVVY